MERNQRRTPNSPYQQAFTQAQDELVKLCQIPTEDIDTISTNMQYLVNWRGYKLDIDVTDDVINITNKDKTFTFSKSRFLDNKLFARKLAYSYQNTIGNAFIRIKSNPKNPSTYSILINKKH